MWEQDFAEVPSANLWLVAYTKPWLHVVFRSHERAALVRVYSYAVPWSVVVAMLTADSIGSFFARNIRGKIEFTYRDVPRTEVLR